MDVICALGLGHLPHPSPIPPPPSSAGMGEDHKENPGGRKAEERDGALVLTEWLSGRVKKPSGKGWSLDRGGPVTIPFLG